MLKSKQRRHLANTSRVTRYRTALEGSPGPTMGLFWLRAAAVVKPKLDIKSAYFRLSITFDYTSAVT
jgi:hypothetical protein